LSAQQYTERTEDLYTQELKEHIKIQILGSDDQDFILDYVKNVMFLENYLISNDITYTFYRAIDDNLYEFKNIGPFDYGSPFILKVEDCTNHNNWYNFSNNSSSPINELGWNSEFVHKHNLCISTTNGHPGFPAINDFSTRLADFVKKQNVL
jgi:hypothetical protein